MQSKRDSSDTARIADAIHFLDVLIAVCRYLPLMVAAIAAVNTALAAYDFMEGSTGWGIVNAVFALGGAMLLAQLLQRRRVRSRPG